MSNRHVKKQCHEGGINGAVVLCIELCLQPSRTSLVTDVNLFDKDKNPKIDFVQETGILARHFGAVVRIQCVLAVCRA